MRSSFIWALQNMKIEQEKFYRGPGIEPGSPALRAGTLPMLLKNLYIGGHIDDNYWEKFFI